MIIENKLMWSPSCDRHRLDDEPRWPLDCLMHTAYTGSARQILLRPLEFMLENPPIKFYDQKAKAHIYEREVKPMLSAALHPYVSKPWEADETSCLLLIWDDFEEFFVNLIWCSRLQIPFVFDLDRIVRFIFPIRDILIKDRKLSDPRLLNDLLAIISLYRKKDAWCLIPSESGRGSALDIWKQLRASDTYRTLSQETHKLGLMRANTIDNHISRIRLLADRAASNRAVSSLVSVAKAGISVFFGPSGKFASDIIGKIVPHIFGRPYVPPIYSLSDIERSFDELYYPNRPDELKGVG